MSSKAKVGAVLVIIALFLLFDAANSFAGPAGGQGKLTVTTVTQSGGSILGEIYIDGTPTAQGTATVNVTAGSHTVSFGQVAGYATPAPISVTVLSMGTSSAQGVYVPSSSGGNPCPAGYVLQNGVCVPSSTTTTTTITATTSSSTTTSTTTGPPSNPQPPVLSLSASPSSPAPSQASTLTLIVADPTGWRDSGALVTWSTNFGSLSVTSATADANGVATTTFTSQTAGTATITVSATYKGQTSTTSTQIVVTSTTGTLVVKNVLSGSPITADVNVNGHDYGQVSTQTVTVNGYATNTVTWGASYSQPQTTIPQPQDVVVAPGQTVTVTGTYYPMSGVPSTVNIHVLCETTTGYQGQSASAPVPGVVVTVDNAFGTQLASQTTDANGMATLVVNAQAGQVTVYAKPPQSTLLGQKSKTVDVSASDISVDFDWVFYMSLLFGSAVSPGAEAIGGVFLLSLGAVMVVSDRKKPEKKA